MGSFLNSALWWTFFVEYLCDIFEVFTDNQLIISKVFKFYINHTKKLQRLTFKQTSKTKLLARAGFTTGCSFKLLNNNSVSPCLVYKSCYLVEINNFDVTK